MEAKRTVPARPGSRLGAWLDDRLGIGGLRYPVPAHANSLAYTLGGITLVSFVGLVITGIYLAQFYDPTPRPSPRQCHLHHRHRLCRRPDP